MRADEPTPNRMPPAEGGAVDAAGKWQDAISGRAPQFTGLQDTKAAADSWLKQPFTTQSERDAKAAADVAAAAAQFKEIQAKFAATQFAATQFDAAVARHLAMGREPA